MEHKPLDAMNSSTYSVKYCGIVDGTMGILSRKVMLTGKDNHSFNNPKPANK
jgi:hypothetical protein